MSWWAPTVLGGSEPLDLVDELTRQMGIWGHGRWYSQRALAQEAIRNFGPDNFLRFILECAPFDPKIAAQVVALVHMAAGVRMRDDIRDLALQGCRYGHVGWDMTQQRQRELEELAELIRDFQAGEIENLHKRQLEHMLGV